jgi:hypothetical protein
MAAREPREEVHHAAPRRLVSLHEPANGGTEITGEAIQAWLEWEMEAMRWRVPVEIERVDLEALVGASEEVLEREKHRLIHESDWRRWGARGGRETLRRYGSEWFALLALRRWGRASAADLDAAKTRRATGTSGTFKPPKTAFEAEGGR